MSAEDTLWRSAANVRRVSNQLDAIISEIENLLQEPSLSFTVNFDDWNDGNLPDDQDPWIYPYYWIRYHVRSRGKSKKLSHLGYVIFAISLWRTEDETGQGWIGAQSAKLYAGFSPYDYGDFSEYFFLDGRGRNAIGKPKPPYLWSFESEDSNSTRGPFLFCLPLLKLESREELKREAIEPLSNLLKPDTTTQATAFVNTQFCYKIPRR